MEVAINLLFAKYLVFDLLSFVAFGLLYLHYATQIGNDDPNELKHTSWYLPYLHPHPHKVRNVNYVLFTCSYTLETLLWVI